MHVDNNLICWDFVVNCFFFFKELKKKCKYDFFAGTTFELACDKLLVHHCLILLFLKEF